MIGKLAGSVSDFQSTPVRRMEVKSSTALVPESDMRLWSLAMLFGGVALFQLDLWERDSALTLSDFVSGF